MADRNENLFLEERDKIEKNVTRDLLIVFGVFVVLFIICAKLSHNFFLSLIISLIIPIFIFSFRRNSNASLQFDRFSKYLKNLKSQYGEYSTRIGKYDFPEEVILVYDKKEILIIKGVKIEFAEILDFSINDMATYKTTSSTESMLGRGLVGGLMFGGVGALAGANTASTTTSKVSSVYKFNIILNDFSEPNFVTEVTNEEDANKLTSILKLIIDKNDSNFDKK